jgi:hypothetical protein
MRYVNGTRLGKLTDLSPYFLGSINFTFRTSIVFLWFMFLLRSSLFGWDVVFGSITQRLL